MIFLTIFVRVSYIFVLPEGSPGGPFRAPEAIGGVRGPRPISDDFERPLAPAGPWILSHVGPKLESCCGQVGACRGHVGVEMAILRLFK